MFGWKYPGREHQAPKKLPQLLWCLSTCSHEASQQTRKARDAKLPTQAGTCAACADLARTSRILPEKPTALQFVFLSPIRAEA